MSRGGFIKLHRKMLDFRWAKHPATVALWVHILLSVEWESTDKLKKGQMLTSYRKLAEETGLSVKQVRTALKHLIDGAQVRAQDGAHIGAQQGTMITVEKWGKYQGQKAKGAHRMAQEGAQEGAFLPLYKENKEIKEGALGTQEAECVPMPPEIKEKMAALFAERRRA